MNRERTEFELGSFLGREVSKATDNALICRGDRSQCVDAIGGERRNSITLLAGTLPASRKSGTLGYLKFRQGNGRGRSNMFLASHGESGQD